MLKPVITVAQMREWEKATWAAGQSQAAVIHHVGLLVARRAQSLTRAGDRILVLAGKGNNGEDARQAAAQLSGREPLLLNVADPLTALEEIRRLILSPPALVIDGLFGIGLNRPLDLKWTQLIEFLNRLQIPILSVDVPSGLDADTGLPRGAAVRANLTLTFGAVKRGLLRQAATEHVGRLELAAHIGLTPCPFQSELNWTSAEEFANWPPRRAEAAHKGSFGHVVVIAGSPGYHGAAVLAGQGALRARPGLVTVLPQADVYHPVAGQLAAAMVQKWQPQTRLLADCDAVVIGPGLAAADLPAELKFEVARIWHGLPIPVIVDASALDWLPFGTITHGSLRVITPHPGEAARMLKSTAAAVEADRPGAVRELSRRWGGCWVVLKGRHTLMGRDTGPLHLNSSGNPGLAQGGSGDVLAGFLGGLLAQPALRADLPRTLRYGVWQHGAAADALAARRANWIVPDLLESLGDVSAA